MDLSKWKCAAHNLVLPNRVSCPECAKAERARLHAACKGSCERGGLICVTQAAYDNGMPPPDMALERLRRATVTPEQIQNAFDAIDAVREANRKRRLEAAQDEARTRLVHEALYGVQRSKRPSVLDEAERMVREHGPKPQRAPGGVTTAYRAQELKHEPPPVGAEVSYDEALEDMKRRPEAVYAKVDWPQHHYRWGDSRYNEAPTLDVNCNGKGWRGLLAGPSAVALEVAKWTRLPDATTVPERSELFCVHEPPPIGAEVPWLVAKRDMQARSEARYRPNIPFQNIHSMINGRLYYHAGCDEGAIGIGMHEARARAYQWVRLA